MALALAVEPRADVPTSVSRSNDDVIQAGMQECLACPQHHHQAIPRPSTHSRPGHETQTDRQQGTGRASHVPSSGGGTL